MTLLAVSVMMAQDFSSCNCRPTPFANERSELVVRWAAVALLAVGFHFDLLAS